MPVPDLPRAEGNQPDACCAGAGGAVPVALWAVCVPAQLRSRQRPYAPDGHRRSDFAAPVGVFPRAMCLDASGRLLLAAGGAVDEAYLLTAPELVRERTIHTQSPCFAAGFWRGGLLLVCAVEGEDIHTAVYTLAPGTPRPRKLIDLPGQPGGLCVCPDGVGALISTRDGLMKLDIPQGRLLWNLPDLALCARPVLPRPHGAGERDAGRPGAAAFPLQAMAFKNRVYGYGCSCLLFDGIIRGRLAHP